MALTDDVNVDAHGMDVKRFGIPMLAPGELGKLTAKNRALLMKRTPRGLLPSAPLHAMRGAGISTVLD